jgi:hypothetical protein
VFGKSPPTVLPHLVPLYTSTGMATVLCIPVPDTTPAFAAPAPEINSAAEEAAVFVRDNRVNALLADTTLFLVATEASEPRTALLLRPTALPGLTLLGVEPRPPALPSSLHYE